MEDTFTFDQLCSNMRVSLKNFYPQLKQLVVFAQEVTPAAVADGDTTVDAQEEMAANVTLALRHLEDASMRLGKAIQAYNGGKSPLDGTMGTVAATNSNANDTDASVSGGAAAAQQDSTAASTDNSTDSAAAAA